MILERNPATDHIRKYKLKLILKRIPELEDCSHDNFLSLFDYTDKIPYKYFSNKVFNDYYKHICNLHEFDSLILNDLFMTYNDSLNTAFKSLDDLNRLDFHDILLPDDEYNLMLLFENKLNPSYLKLVEAVYANLIIHISAYLRIKRKASLEGFDVYNRVEEIRNSEFQYIASPYNNTIRNAIAHGNVIYKNLTLIYRDKNNIEDIMYSRMFEYFDDLLDICNGIALAYKVYCFKYREDLEENSVMIPLQIVLAEVKAENEGFGWKIKAFFLSETIDNKSQLIVFTYNTYLDKLKLLYYLFRSVIITEKYAPYFQRYFFRLESKYFLPGWADFDGQRLKELRENGDIDLGDYGKAFMDKIIYFNTKIRIPRLFFKIQSFVSIAYSIIKIKLKEQKGINRPISIDVRDTKIHRNGFNSVINACVIIELNSGEEIKNLIKSSLNRIYRKTKNVSKNSLTFYNILKYLKPGYVSIKVFTHDFRKRKLRNSGLIPDLLCTIERKKLKKIKTIDIFGGVPEVIGKYRVVWNRRAFETI